LNNLIGVVSRQSLKVFHLRFAESSSAFDCGISNIHDSSVLDNKFGFTFLCPDILRELESARVHLSKRE